MFLLKGRTKSVTKIITCKLCTSTSTYLPTTITTYVIYKYVMQQIFSKLILYIGIIS